MQKIYRIMGKRGRTTIPYPIRVHMEFHPSDLISFQPVDGGILIKKEPLCSPHSTTSSDMETDMATVALLDLLDSLSPDIQKDALLHLIVSIAKKNLEEDSEFE